MKHLLLLASLCSVLVACQSGPEIQGLMKSRQGINQYFDRLSEFSSNGNHPNYQTLLGYNFQDARHLLMSTNLYNFGTIATNYAKERRFVVINPFDIAVKGVQYVMEGSPFFVLEDGNCKPKLQPFAICSLKVKFYPNGRGAIETVAGLHKGVLKVSYPGGYILRKPFLGTAR